MSRSTRAFAWTAFAATFALLLASPLIAYAEDGKCKGPIGVLKPDPAEGPADRALADAKPGNCQIEKLTVSRTLRDQLNGRSNSSSPAIIASVRAYLREVDRSDLSLIVVFASKKAKDGTEMRVFVMDRTGSLLSEEPVTVADSQRDPLPFGHVTLEALDAAVVRPEPQADKSEKTEEPEPAGSTASVGHADPVVDFRLGLAFVGRWLDYAESNSANLRTFSLLGKGTVQTELVFHPFAQRENALRGLSAEIAYRRSIGSWPSILATKNYDTEWEAWEIFAQYRLALGTRPKASKANPVRPAETYMGFELGHMTDKFRFQGGPPAVAPEALMRAFALGINAQIPAGPVAVQFGGRFMLPYDTGGYLNAFPDSSLLGLSLRVGAEYHVTNWFAPGLRMQYDRWFASLNPPAGSTLSADGARDQRFSFEIASTLRF